LHVLSPASETSASDLSVVIVAYRARSVVLACLDTLVSSGGLDGLEAEVIVVDNASDDGTAEMVRSHFPGVRLIANAENAGFARANNQGLRVATGRHVLLLNPDTLVPHGALRACVDFLDAQDESVAAMSCRVLSPDGSLQWTCSRRLVTPWSECCRALLLDRAFARVDLFNREPELRWDRSVTREVECLLGAFMLLRRAALDRIGGLDERFFLMYEDVDWCKRARDAGYRLLFWPGASITHLGGASWKQEPVLTFANSHVSAVQFFRKHHPASVGVVLFVSRLGMALKEGLLRLSLLRKPGDEYTVRHLAMARAAREALRTGSAGRRAKWIDPAPGEGAQA
jgi:GT2 family glycosyltransferase